MKALIIGLGSMGKRRLRLLKNNFEWIEVYGADTRKERCQEVEQKFGVPTYECFETAFEETRPDVVFVCTPPLSHKGIVLYSLKRGAHTFSELNLRPDGYKEIITKSREVGKVAFLSSTMLYRKEIQYIKQRVKNVQPVSYRYHVGQYLPDWHPWESYKDFFVGAKETNGCRELMAVEFPWIIKTFGSIERIHVVSKKMTNLDITYNDNFHILLEHSTKTIGAISIDVISRKAVRSFETYSESFHLFWDGTPESLREYNPKKKECEQLVLYETTQNEEGYEEFIIEDAYLEEIRAFFDNIQTKKIPVYTYVDDLYVLQTIDEIEKLGEM